VRVHDRHVQLASRAGVSCVLLYGDLDDFKPINDVYGHGAGDAALAAVGKSLREVFRESDQVARLGGDEFAVLASGATAEAIPELERRVGERHSWNTPPTPAGIPLYRLAISLGFVEAPLDSTHSAALLLREADARQYEAKKRRGSGRRATRVGKRPEPSF
jgi:diguanylate cyclase (GGDEF)-like protein